MTDEVVTQTADKEWDQVSKDREAQTRAGESDQPVVSEAGKAEAAPDPLDGLPEPTRKLIEGLQAKTANYDSRFQKMNQQLATANGTIGNLKQRLDESQVKLQKIDPVIAATEAQKKADEKTAAEARVAKRAAAREKLADVFEADVVDELMPADAKPAETQKSSDEIKKEAKPESKPDIQADPGAPDKNTEIELMLDLTDRVPGWRAKRDSAEFKTWLPTQSADIKAKAGSWDVDDAASVFEAFDKHKSDAAQVARVEKDRQERLRRGENIQGRGSSTSDVDTGPDALWNKVTRDREKARASG